MSRVTGLGIGGIFAGKSKSASTGAASGGFNIAADGAAEGAAEIASEGQAATQGTQAAPRVMLSNMLALQEVETESLRDKAARRHGFALLQALLALQQGLLSGLGDSEMDVAALGRLVTGMPEAADPALTEILDAVRLRAKIELLRRGVDIRE